MNFLSLLDGIGFCLPHCHMWDELCQQHNDIRLFQRIIKIGIKLFARMGQYRTGVFLCRCLFLSLAADNGDRFSLQFINGYYEIVWPERRKIAIGKRETMHFRDGDRLYLSEWVEDPDYREFIIVRDIHTGKILEKTEGYIRRLPNHVVWQI